MPRRRAWRRVNTHDWERRLLVMLTRQAPKPKKKTLPEVDTSWLEFDLDAPPQNAAHAAPGQLNLHEGTENDTDAVLIPRDSIEAGTLNARVHFDPHALKELGESLKTHGQLQPILVRPHPRKDGKYEIVAGERRWRAAGASY